MNSIEHAKMEAVRNIENAARSNDLTLALDKQYIKISPTIAALYELLWRRQTTARQYIDCRHEGIKDQLMELFISCNTSIKQLLGL